MSNAAKVTCFKCGRTSEFPDRVGFFAACDCGEDSHVCKNCQFYDVKAYNECREPQAEVVKEKERANRCEYFQPRTGEGPVKDPKADLMNAAEALFKKK